MHVSLCTRSGGSDKYIPLVFSLSPDFNLLTEEVVITSTDTEPCIVFIALADSLALEGEETLTLSLSGPESVMFSNTTITITIVDADSTYTNKSTCAIVYLNIALEVVDMFCMHFF